MLKNLSNLHQKIIVTIGAVLLILLGLWVAFAPTYSALHYYRLKKDLAGTQAKNKKLIEENSGLRDEIDRLANDPAYLEEVARKRYGLIRKNETLI